VYACGLVLLALLTFSPSRDGEFLLWDDSDYVLHNEVLGNPDGVAQIWNPWSRKLPQYYPLTFMTYWIEYRLWWLDPRGYHATNLVLHALNSTLVLLVVRSLGASLPLAGFTSAIFAVHPVQVESVAWIAERKNLLSGFFYLLAFLQYLKHGRSGAWAPYACSLLFFAAALLSKTQTLTLPFVLLAADLLLRRLRIGQASSLFAAIARVLPMLVLASLTSAVTISLERQLSFGEQYLPRLEQRPLIAAAAIWFYTAKFLLPIGLAPIYSKWSVAPTELRWWLPLVSLAVAGILLLRYRRHLPALAWWGIVQFIVSLTPILGIVPFNYMRHSYVANHFLYLPCIGGGLALGALAGALARRFGTSLERLQLRWLAATFVLAFAFVSYQRSYHWKREAEFWRYALETGASDVLAANYNLAMRLRFEGRWTEALPLFRRAAEIEPENPLAFSRYIEALDAIEDDESVIEACTAKLAQRPAYAESVHYRRALSLEQVGRYKEALRDYEQALRLSPPGSHLRLVIPHRIAALKRRGINSGDSGDRQPLPGQ
jgi:tetratricopeptide (TPR) repeat protein